ncbi:MAG: hypothetical protein LBF01_02670, partial [Bacteroidales bacterium]|nr:hypothetical protein [Bacteroidales bacterium]
ASFENEHCVSAEIAVCKISTAKQKSALEQALLKVKPKDTLLVWKRYFISDAYNQKYSFENASDLFSVVQQPPLNGSKISVLVYFVSSENSKIKYLQDNTVLLERPDYKHFFTGQLFCREGNTFEQTKCIFTNYIEQLKLYELSLADNTVRTWIYVQDIDHCYGDMVSARNEVFAQEGLVKHSIASTGIEGRGVHLRSRVIMDAYAINVKPEQITFLNAETHLSSACEYGSSFERGVIVNYADRRHIFISGTASIDNRGKIVAHGDIKRQLARTLENIEALLKEGDTTLNSAIHFMIYLRDSGDYPFVENYFNTNFADTPRVIVHAPVCRPGWLIEIECIAMTEQPFSDPEWKNF